MSQEAIVYTNNEANNINGTNIYQPTCIELITRQMMKTLTCVIHPTFLYLIFMDICSNILDRLCLSALKFSLISVTGRSVKYYDGAPLLINVKKM